MAAPAVVDDAHLSHLVSQLTLDEKLSLLAGASQWRTAAIPRLQIPPLKVSDGPSGARGEIFGEGVPAAFVPSGVSLGATWDVGLMEQIGQHLAEECKSKSASTLLAPTMCIHRHPLGGRNFESFSEDPYLTGKLATAHVNGLQSRGIGATPKHFVANDQETQRYKVNAVVGPRALREVYLLPFQMVVRDARPWAMMAAYNKLNGSYCHASKEILTDIARGEWEWDGVFTSDWGGTPSTVESINHGLDLEMPGPPLRRSPAALAQPLKDGLLDMAQIDRSVWRILNLLRKAGRFQDARDDPEYCRDMDDPATNTRALLRRAAASGIVMLKNDDQALPLQPGKALSKVAVVGPNAKRVVAGGGGSAYIKAPYWTSVFDSLSEYYQARGTDIEFHVGAKVNRYVPTPDPSVAWNPESRRGGARLEWHLGHDLDSDVVATSHVDDLYFMGFGDVPPEIGRLVDYSFRAHTTLSPRTSGRHTISLASLGPSKLFFNGDMILQQSGAFEEKESLFFTYGSGEATMQVDMEAGKEYHIRIDYHSHDRQLDPAIAPLLEPMEDKFQGFRLGFQEASSADLPSQAAHIARACDAAIVVVGRDKEWETEGEDIPIFELPGEQVRLIQEVASVCKRTIVVVQAGTPVRLEPWIDQVQAVLYTWYQGQELGNGALDVINGTVNPSGRSPVTFPRRIQDCPAYSSFPGEQLQSHYSEGLYVGYKWWDLVGTRPHFPIGFGLSYTTFSVSPVKLSSVSLRQGCSLKATVSAANTGTYPVPGQETVIIWHSQRSPRLRRPVKQICGFVKTPLLGPGQEATSDFDLDPRDFGMFDPDKGTWIVDAGSVFDILVGTNWEDAVPVWQVTAPDQFCWLK